MPSSITEEDVLKLREARYLTYEISHRLPAKGQVIPTPDLGERGGFDRRLNKKNGHWSHYKGEEYQEPSP